MASEIAPQLIHCTIEKKQQIFALIVFGSIASEDLYKQDQCPLNGDPHACGFGIAVGVLAFLICLLFLIVDARFDSFSNVQTRKKTVIADTAISGKKLNYFIFNLNRLIIKGQMICIKVLGHLFGLFVFAIWLMRGGKLLMKSRKSRRKASSTQL